ncbi:MAG: phosphoenolpyruvate--protein phosphotransferase [Gemmatimonadetes bacterium]|nr:phosphoenolpyruvate--protein phosphotransferase [Gemmatimonadota bacterium]
MSLLVTGVPASPGIVIGPVHLLRWEVPEVPARTVPADTVDHEVARLHAACDQAVVRLRKVRDRVEQHAGPEEAAIFDVQISICDDADLRQSVETLIRQGFAAEKAFDLVLLEWREHFARSTNALMRERVSDLLDVQIRVLSLLLDLPDRDPVDLPKGSNAILITHDLTPSLTVQFDREAISAIATDAGTGTSHVAILARSLGLPAVVGLRDATAKLTSGMQAIVDGTHGLLILDPSEKRIAEYRRRAHIELEEARALQRYAQADSVTVDGVRITLRANVDLPDEAAAAATSGAEGVGLMRTEFLVVGRAAMPDEDEQYEAYSRVLRAFAPHPVVIRTYDIGGDKLPVGGFPHEANPFLGWRAIRMCLDEPELFKVQLRALMRAAVHGDLRIMLPLIVSVDEVRQARALLVEAAGELRARDVPHRSDLPLGVMIETPAAVITADALAKETAFFSIGTNDLVQYTLAVDRGNIQLVKRFTALHPAVLRLIKRTQDEGAAAGIEVSVCGEMASQPLMAFALVGLGVRQLSVAPRSVAAVKHLIRTMRTSAATDAVAMALEVGTADAAEKLLKERLLAELQQGGEAADGLLALVDTHILPDPVDTH